MKFQDWWEWLWFVPEPTYSPDARQPRDISGFVIVGSIVALAIVSYALVGLRQLGVL